MKHPIETKVVAATGSAAGGSVLSAFGVWLLGVLVWGAPSDAGHADDAVLAVPTPVSALLILTVTAAATWLGGYLARHTAREDRGSISTSEGLVIAVVLVLLVLLVAPRLRG